MCRTDISKSLTIHQRGVISKNIEEKANSQIYEDLVNLEISPEEWIRFIMCMNMFLGIVEERILTIPKNRRRNPSRNSEEQL